MIDRLTFTGHSLDQMQDRGLTPSVVENTIDNGARTPGVGARAGTTSIDDTENRIRAVLDDEDGRVITVITIGRE